MTHRRLLRITAAAALLAAVGAPLAAQPRTGAETSGFTRHTTHGEMMDYLLALRAGSTDMRLSTYGETREGRVLPYAIFSRPMVTQPSEATLLGRPVVLLAANVHGGERTLRESVLILMRELATRGTAANALLDELVILVAPQINPDGFHASPGGQRGNAWGIDLNRDYIKLEHPEIAGYVSELLHEWNPHLFVDGHNGGSFPYNVNYQCPSNAAADLRITQLCDDEIFPAIDRLLATESFKSFWYTGGTPTRWNTGGWQARIGRNYGGFRNTVGILFESPGGQEMRPAVRSGELAYRAVIDWAAGNAARLMSTVNTARLETLRQGQQAEGQVVVEMTYGPEDRRVTYEIAQGQGQNRRVVQVTSDSLMKKPIPLKTRARPYAYILPRDAIDAVAMLRRHGITVEQLRDSVTLDVTAYTIANVGYTPQYNHAAAVLVTVGEETQVRRRFPAGTYVVPTGQVLGRIVSHMLEPETDDNVVYWNTMDAWLPRPASGAAAADDEEPGPRESGPPLVPIFKLMTPRPLPSMILPEGGR